MLRTTVWILSLIFAGTVLAAPNSELVRKANQGDPDAQYQLALSYQKNTDAPKNTQDAFYWLQQAANNDNQLAMLPLAQAYLNGTGTKVDTTQGLYWLTRLAILGDAQAQYQLGKTYEQLSVQPTSLDNAQLWFHIAAATLPEAEQAYSAILEKKFNQQRAKQVSAISQIDKLIDSPNNSTSSPIDKDPEQVEHDYLLLTVTILLLLSTTLFFRRIKFKKHNRLKESSNNADLQKQLDEKSIILKKQKKQLDTIYRELKRLQQSQSEHTKAQRFELACAVFGFIPNQVPDEKTIKMRYKQLCKIYHPDMKGSEEEMKRLNGALKTIMQHVNN